MKARPLIGALAVCALLAAACGGAKNPAMAVLKVRKGTFQIVLPAFGELQAAKSTPIVVPAPSGNQSTSLCVGVISQFVHHLPHPLGELRVNC